MWEAWGKHKIFPMYGVTGDGNGNWDVDIFWGNAINKGDRAVQLIKRFKPGKTDPAKIQKQALDIGLKKSTVAKAFKAHESCNAKERAIKYVEKMRREEPVRERSMPESTK